MPKIDEPIKNALRQAIEAAGSQKDFERKTGIAQQNLSRYLSGAIPTMTERTWKDIYPYLKVYLPESHCSNISGGSNRSGNGSMFFNQTGKVIQYTGKSAEEIERHARESVIDEIMAMDDEIDPKVILQICKRLKKNQLEE